MSRIANMKSANKFGEQGHSRRTAQGGKNGDQAYALLREVHRLHGVMNLGLCNKIYLATGEYSIANMICYPLAITWQSRADRFRRIS